MDKFTAADFVKLCAKTTSSRSSNATFTKRMADEKPSHSRTVYPLVQGYDSVALEADCRAWRSDQNLTCDRAATCNAVRQEPQSSSRRRCSKDRRRAKMSKSLGNYIGIDESAEEMFGKVMSISDDLMWNITSCSPPFNLEISNLKSQIENGGIKKHQGFSRQVIIADFIRKADADAAKKSL